LPGKQLQRFPALRETLSFSHAKGLSFKRKDRQIQNKTPSLLCAEGNCSASLLCVKPFLFSRKDFKF